MHKNKDRMKKLHNGSVKRKLVAGTLALFFATILGMCMFQVGRNSAWAKGGAFTRDDNFLQKHSIYLPDGLILKQKVVVNDSSLGEKTLENSSPNNAYNDEKVHTYTISRSFAREGVFKPAITSSVVKNYDTASEWESSIEPVEYMEVEAGCNTVTTAISKVRKFSYLNASKKDDYTYYKIHIDGSAASTKPMGQIFFEYYTTNYSGDKSNQMIAVTTDDYGRAVNGVLEACAAENGWIKYTTDSEIELYRDGNVVNKIEMLTVSPVDFWFESLRVYDNGLSNSADLDVMLYTSHTYEFNYEEDPVVLELPTIETEGGKNLFNGEVISEDDELILGNGNNPVGAAKIQYYLSDVKQTGSIPWEDYTGPIKVSGKRYLYTRSYYADGNKKYVESDFAERELHYMNSSSAVIKSVPESGEGVDAGTTVELSYVGAEAGSAIFYVVGENEKPTLTRKVPYTERKDLNLDAFSTDGFYAQKNDKTYLKINNLWYECSDNSVKKYTDPIVIDESIRELNSTIIYAYVIDNGHEPGDFQTLSYTYFPYEKTAEPESTIPTSASEPAEVNMGAKIDLLCNTSGSKIFYTTNGSAPVITIDPINGPKKGKDTEEYTIANPIIVNEEFAEYGKSFLIMAQAVTYKQTGDSYVCVYQDSSVAKFTYVVGKQPAVKDVQSVPKTNSDTPTEVQVGSRIQLYSETEGVTIYYTLDGSEPTFKESETEPGKMVPGENTTMYVGATGVVVPKSEDSSLFTITAVAYKDGLAVSDIVRLIFAYPGSVSSPYANPAEGAVTENTEVILKTATDGAVIYYEVAEGDKVPDEPTTTASRVFDETNPIKITKKTTIKAIAVKDTIESPVVTLQYTVSSKLETPTPSIDTGAVISSGTVISLSAESGATIYYTLDGSDPRDPENKKVQVGNQAVINGKSGDMIVLRAYAAKNGYSSSEVGTYSYSLSAYAGGIYADREDGEILKNGEVVNLHTDMSNADIYYTTDGSAPSKDSHKGSSVTIHGNPGEKVTVMAIAIAKGSDKSTSFATFTYTIMDKLSAPTSSVPDGATFTRESAVELKAEKGRIYYTTDGTEPTTSSNLYKKSIVIEGPITIKAMVVAEDLQQSDVSTFTYGFADQVAAPIASYASGELEMGTKITFTCETEGATIYYRTDGKDINLARKNELEIYKEPITINQATNFKVIAVKDKMQDSQVLKVGYTVKEPVVIEAVEEGTSQNMGNQSNRLQSRRSFSDTESGPSYTDVILKNASYGTIVAAEEGTLPEQVQLVVQTTNVTDAVNQRVKQVLSDNFGVVASYDVKLLVNGEETHPDGDIEIGLPIPVEYENAMIYIIHVQEDGNIELYETRRSGGVAYAKVDHLSVYSITAPVEFDEEKAAFPWLPIMYTLAVGFTGLGIGLIYKAKKQRREEVM